VFARRAAGVNSAEAVSTGEYVHVYSGRLTDGRPVRFLVLAPAYADDGDARGAFERAADRWERASGHRAIVAVLARGTDPGPWLAVEQVDGQRLDDAGAALSLAELRSVVADAAEGLREGGRADGHGAGLTPAHVWVCRDRTGVTGRIEWGLDRACRVAAGEAVPSPYAAPELTGNPTEATAATDVYALGAITYAAATGQPPADADGDGAGDDGRVRPPSAVDPSLPATLDTVVLRALSADPGDRYATPYEFKLALLFDLGGADSQPPGGQSRAGGGEDGAGRRTGAGDQDGSPDRWTAAVDRPTRRAALGVLGLATVGGGLLAARRLGDNGSAPATGGPVGTPEWPDQGGSPEAEFAFQFTADPAGGGVLTVEHGGGDRIRAGNLLLRSDALEGSPRRWSDDAAYEPDDRIGAGDSLAVTVETPFSVSVAWAVNGHREELANWSTAGEVERSSPLLSGPPSASFVIEYADGVVTARHEAGDVVPVSQLQFRGEGFSGEPAIRWSETPDGNAEALVQPGDRIQLDAAEDAVVHLLWLRDADGALTTVDQEAILSQGGPVITTPDRQSILAQFYGPGRPLDAGVGGVSTGRYGPENAGVGAGVTGPAGGATGQWSFASGRPTTGNLLVFGAMAPSPVVGGGTVYAGSTDGALYAIDAVDGAELWRLRAGAFSSATLQDGRLYVGGEDLLAVDPADGSILWRVENSQHVVGPPRVVDGTVYAVTSTPPGGAVYAVDADDGSRSWIDREREGVVRPPAVVDGTVYVSGSDVVALSAADGHTRWTYESGMTPTAPAVADGTLYVGGADESKDEGGVTALDPSDGSVRWQQPTPGPVFASPVPTDGAVYAAGGVSTDGTLTAGFLAALAADDGSPSGRVGRGSPITYPPTVADGTVYAVDGENHVVAVDAGEWTTRWTLRVDDDLRGPPVVTDGRLFVAGERHSVHAFWSPSRR
jgi:outer membrane protein assembly factor BamB